MAGEGRLPTGVGGTRGREAAPGEAYDLTPKGASEGAPLRPGANCHPGPRLSAATATGAFTPGPVVGNTAEFIPQSFDSRLSSRRGGPTQK